MEQKKYLWVAYSRAPLRLPVAVADSPGELAKLMGVKKSSVLSTVSRFKESGRFAKIEIEED